MLAVLATARQAPVTGDETQILFVSATFAESQALASPLLEGTLSDGSYFLSLPAIHFVHWPLLALAAAHHATLRFISLAFVMLLIGSAAWIVHKRMGAMGALVVVALLVLWRNGVHSSSHGLALIGVGRSLRYDAMVAGLMALSIPLTEAWLRTRRPWLELVLGAVVGLALLTHFPAWVLPPVLGLTWALTARPRPGIASLMRVLLVAAVIVAPYVLWLRSHWDLARNQIELVHGGRWLDGPGGLVANLISEPARFAALLGQAGIGPPLFVIALVGVSFHALFRMSRLEGVRRVAAVHLLVFLAVLALFESTKAAIYVLPAIVPALVLILTLVEEQIRTRGRFLAVLLIVILVGEGALAVAYDVRAIRRLRPYDEIVETIRSQVPDPERWVGPIRWGWGFRDDAYRPLAYMGIRSGRAEDMELAFRTAWDEFEATMIVETPEWRDDVARLTPGQSAFVRVVSTQCAAEVLSIDDAAYGPLTVRRIDRPCVAAIISGTGPPVAGGSEPVR